MDRLRRPGGRPLTSTPSMSTRPPVGWSNPLMIRNAVDLPQPDGPTTTVNERCPMVSDGMSKASWLSYRLVIASKWIMSSPQSRVEEGIDDAPRRDQVDRHDRRGGDHRRGQQ